MPVTTGKNSSNICWMDKWIKPKRWTFSHEILNSLKLMLCFHFVPSFKVEQPQFRIINSALDISNCDQSDIFLLEREQDPRKTKAGHSGFLRVTWCGSYPEVLPPWTKEMPCNTYLRRISTSFWASYRFSVSPVSPTHEGSWTHGGQVTDSVSHKGGEHVLYVEVRCL